MAFSLPPPTPYGTDGHTVAELSPGAIKMYLVIMSLRQGSLKTLRINVYIYIYIHNAKIYTYNAIRHNYDDRKEQNKIKLFLVPHPTHCTGNASTVTSCCL
jgi:hypothetical protein